MDKLALHLQKYGPAAMVLGSAEGLGFAFAEILANCGKQTIMVDWDQDSLEQAADRVSSSGNLRPIQSLIDLSHENAYREVFDLAITHDCGLIVYNAAYGPVKKFVENDISEIDRYIDLHCRTLAKLAHATCQEPPNLPLGFLAMSSLSALRGTNFVAPYAATKAFVWNLMEGLHAEMEAEGIDFTAFLAGPIDTPNYRATGLKRVPFSPAPAPPQKIAREALMALGKKPFYIQKGPMRLAEFALTRLFPRRIAVSIVNNTMKRMRK